MAQPVDMVTLQVVMNALLSITDEMNMALIRTAYSTNIKDRRDCSCALYTTAGEVISQSELGSPVHLGVMPSALDNVLAQMAPEDLRPGDHIAVNVPYPTGPGHLNDIALIAPIFIDGALAFYAANMAHHVDVGGYAPGSMAAGLREIYQEGLQIPPVKLVKRGVVDRELLALIVQNVRTEREVEGDIHAQLACNHVGSRRLVELAGRYGLAELNRYIEASFDYAERRMRAGLAAMPSGTYRAEDFIEGTAQTRELIKIAATVTVGPDAMVVDFSGTDAQVDESFNSNLACVRSACYYIAKVLIDPGLPPNIGSYRPLRVTAPQGTVVNARPPAAVANATIITAPKVVDVLLAALVEAVPERAAAASYGVTSLLNLGGTDPASGALYNYIETYAGGQGAMHDQDGMDAVQCHMTNTRNAPVEVLEATYPIFLRHYGLAPDSEGPGCHRGGLGMRREVEVLSATATLSWNTDRSKLKPWGVAGGGEGANSRCRVERADGSVEDLPYSKMTFRAARGDVIAMQTPGAGGWGDPLTRDEQKVLWDVREGLVSAERAALCYGVKVRRDSAGEWVVDREATAKLRDPARRESKTARR